MSDESEDTGHAGTAYLQHIRDQLAEQRDRKKSLEQRGQASVTTSGALAALLLAFSDLGVLDLEESVTAQVGVVGALVLLVIGAIAGVVAAMPATYKETSVAGMRDWTKSEKWSRSLRVGERGVATTCLDIVEAAKTANRSKANALIVAVSLQAGAVAFIAGTVLFVVT